MLSRLLEELAAAGKPNTAKIYRNHGVTGDVWGVSYQDLNRLYKQWKDQPELALPLWQHGNHDARILACKLVKAAQLSREQIQDWIAAVDNHVLVGAVSEVVTEHPDAEAIALANIDDVGEWPASVGWCSLTSQVMRKSVATTVAEPLLQRIETSLLQSANRVRYNMNNCLIAIGITFPTLTDAAIDCARQLGPIKVDHGKTSCKTPEAVSYIQRSLARRKRA